ncbi:MAG: hypothetical protein ABEH81_02025 [Halopenitus sp.]
METGVAIGPAGGGVAVVAATAFRSRLQEQRERFGEEHQRRAGQRGVARNPDDGDEAGDGTDWAGNRFSEASALELGDGRCRCLQLWIGVWPT